MCALHPLLEKVESYRSRKGESVTDVEESDHHIVRMGERDDSGEESEWETDEEGEGDPQENENEEKERQDGVGRVVGSQKEGKRSVW